MIFSSSSRRRSPCQTKDLSHKLYDILREKKNRKTLGRNVINETNRFVYMPFVLSSVYTSASSLTAALPLCHSHTLLVCAFFFFPVLLFTFFYQYRFDSLTALPHTHLCYLPLARFACVHNSQKILIFAHCTSPVFSSFFLQYSLKQL